MQTMAQGYVKSYFIKLKRYGLILLKRRAKPHNVGMGVAVGAFINVIPTPGLGFVLGFIISLLFKRINKFALWGALLLLNPFFLAPIYILGYKLGMFVCTSLFDYQFESKIYVDYVIMGETKRFVLGYLYLGNFILACIISTIGYFLSKNLLIKYRKKLNILTQ